LKNDRVDAERLVHLLKADLLPRVWIPSQPLRQARELVRHRVSLVRTRTAIKNQLLALLARRNLQPTSTQGWLTRRGQQELQTLGFAPWASLIRAQCLTLLHELDRQVRTLDQELIHHWGTDARVQRLQTIPGVGPFVAIVLVLEVGEIHRFPSAKHLASYVGLTPRVRASADQVRSGHISKEGNSMMRWVLVLAATQAARQPGPLRAWFRALQKRKGTKIARVALARRLVEIVYRVWKEELDYFAVLGRGSGQGCAREVAWSSDRLSDWATPSPS
jgi:transposase